jgi:uncharacterized protein with PQ loop repeat
VEYSQVLASVVGVFGVVMGAAPMLQIARMVRRRRSGDLSLMQLCIVLVGTSLWLAYGLSVGDATIIVPNVVSTLMNAVTLAAALHFRRVGVVAPAAAEVSA